MAFIEREVDVETALSRLESELRSKGWSKTFRTEEGEGLHWAECLIFGADGTLLARGEGKGEWPQVCASAQFEAFERCFFDYERFFKDQCELLSLGDVLSRDERDLAPFVEDRLLEKLRAAPASRVYWAKAEDLLTGKKLLYAPSMHDGLAMERDLAHLGQDLDFSWMSAVRLDVHMASGCSFKEAVINAALEGFEREGTGKFLYDCFARDVARPPRVFDRTTLPEHLRSLLTNLETKYEEFIVVMDWTTQTGLPCVGMMRTRRPQPVQYYSAGCSFDREKAFLQALGEMAQDLIDPLDLTEWHARGTSLYEGREKLLKAFNRDLNSLLKAGFTESVSFGALPESVSTTTVDESFDLMIEFCRNRRIPIYAHECNVGSAEGLSVVKVFLPTVSNFWLVQGPALFLPNVLPE